MKSFDTQAHYKELVATGLSEQQASAIIKITSMAIQVSTENAIENIKRQHRLDDGVTKHDLRLFEMKQDDAFNQFKHDLKMQENQASIAKSKREIEFMKIGFVAFYGLLVGLFIGSFF
ncbi:MAG: hypothetical protein PHN45_04350 [Methylococcales bacterium]|nr:hypothetical protein [Methylococcales bacterium]MDD5753966.1 hypothetical protein [Methylococcales bacterium]